MALVEDFELGEDAVIIIVVALAAYLLYQLFSGASEGLNQLGATLANLFLNFPGVGSTMNQSQADSLAKGISTAGVPYILSADGFSIVWSNGAHYNNANGHMYSANGSDLGALRNPDGSSNSSVNALATFAVETSAATQQYNSDLIGSIVNGGG